MDTSNRVIIRTKAKQDFRFQPSFGPYIKFLRKCQESSTGFKQKFYNLLIKKLEQFPELLKPFDHHAIGKEHHEQMELVEMSLIPLVSASADFPMALAFMQPEIFFHYTDSFKKLVIDEEVNFNTSKDEYNLLRYFQKHILERFYKRLPDNIQHFYKKVVIEEKKSVRHFRIEIDSRFTEVSLTGNLPDYKPEWHELLYLPEQEYFASRHLFPFSSFSMEGFLVIHVEDASEQAAINKLNNAIVKNIPNISLNETISRVQLSMAELLHDADIRVGITPFFNINGQMLFDETFETRSLLVWVKDKCPEDRMSLTDIQELFGKNPHPFIYSKTDAHLRKNRKFLKGLEAKGLNSYMAYPLFTRDGLQGVFELGSTDPDVITEATIQHIQLALPIINDVAYLMMQSFNSMLDQLVKQEFTSLQPSVEWKFKKVAFDYLVTSAESREHQKVNNIFFEKVYPVFGAIDIKNSSSERNAACARDYQLHLQSAIDLFREIAPKVNLPLLEGLEYKARTFLKLIAKEMSAENELKINELFTEEIDPLMKYLGQKHKSVSEVIEKYIYNTGLQEGEFHKNRRSYQQSVELLNDNISLFFENEVQKLQKTFPFYFEKYRTDGVEYNIYIGPSIVPDQPYNPIYLENLRLWQITSMAEIMKIIHKMNNDLPQKLETTQLILVYSTPIDISFRKDERRFDVAGSYNIKYEIIKKRIDKVRIKSTLERLTKPGCIGIVFNNHKDMEEYREHIEFLQDKGIVTSFENNIELEDLQGVSGLKALRLGIALEQPEPSTVDAASPQKNRNEPVTDDPGAKPEIKTATKP